MDKSLANLILENDESLYPYLKLRAHYELRGQVSESEAIRLVGDQNFRLLVDSGFVRRDSIVVFKDGPRWLYEPPSKTASIPTRKTPNFDLQLDKIAELAGVPVDYHKNRGKYRALYRRLYDKYGFDQIETIAYDNRGIGLQLLLTGTYFKSLVAKFEAESR